MLDTPGLIPKSMAPAILGYLVVCYGLGDVFTDRLATWVHIPACQRRLAVAATDPNASQRQAARDMLGELFRSMPGLREMPGVAAVEILKRAQQIPAAPSAFANRCACLAAAARSQTRFEQTLWVASLRVIEPAGVSDFAGVMARLDDESQCAGGRP